jgi:F0F1-type ATP synthase delta subunit
MLDELAEANDVSLLDGEKRKKLLKSLEELLEKSPTIHISFASEPSNDFLQKIVSWSRKNVHPYSLINVGLQPSVIVGCEVRTTNKVFDMSLRNKFGQMREVLIKKLEEPGE